MYSYKSYIAYSSLVGIQELKGHLIKYLKVTQRRYKYSSTHTQPRPYKGVGGQCQALASLLLGKTGYPLHRRLGELWGLSGPDGKTHAPEVQTLNLPVRSESLYQLRWKHVAQHLLRGRKSYEGWNFYSGNYLFTTDTK